MIKVLPRTLTAIRSFMKNCRTSIARYTFIMSKAAVETHSGSQRLLQALSALRHRNYRLYWFGQLSSVLAQNMEGVAQGWLVLELTNSPLLLGTHRSAFAAPTIALTLLGGVIADRADRRRIMILSQTVSAMTFFLLASLIVIEWIALWHVMVCAILLRLRARFRSAEPHGAVTADGAPGRYSQCRRHRRHDLAAQPARRARLRGYADLS